MSKIESRKFIAFTLMALILAGTVSLWGQFAGGNGTEEDPWQIETAEHLNNVRNYVGEEHSDKHFIQTANINLGVAPWNTGEGWVPIGVNTDDSFRGNYNGQDFAINGLFINRPQTHYQGLFGWTRGATIKNLGVTNVNIRGRSSVGSLVSTLVSSSIMSNCYSSGNVVGQDKVGGLVGCSEGFSSIINSYSTALVSGSSRIGGLAGSLQDSTIRNSYSTGNVVGLHKVGGLVGYLGSGHTLPTSICLIINSYSTGNVTVTGTGGYVGGLVGYSIFTEIINSYYNYSVVLINGVNLITVGALDSVLYTSWTDNDMSLDIDEYLTRDGDEYLINDFSDFKKLLAFGQFEEHSFTLTDNIDLSDETDFFIPYFSGSFDGNGNSITNLNINQGTLSIVGLFGITMGANISNLAVLDVEIRGRDRIGGLVGHNFHSTISNCFTTGNLIGHTWIGGLVALNVGLRLLGGNEINQSIINNSYSRASVTGERYIGGLVSVHYDAKINNSYSTGRLIGNSHVYGLVYLQMGETEIVRSYWDIQTSGQETSAGGEGRSTAEMTYPYAGNSYVDWDFFNTWCYDVGAVVNDGYPFMLWQGSVYPKYAVNPNPVNDTTNVLVDLEKLDWSYFRHPFFVNPVGFKVYFNTSGEFGEDDEHVWVDYVEDRDNYSTSDILPEKLDYYTTYYWKVVPTTTVHDERSGGRNSRHSQRYGQDSVLSLHRGDAENVPIWTFRTEQDTSVENVEPKLITSLYGNYPNPFNPETIIEFTIKEDTEATLHIYNLKGQLVITLHNGSIKAGEHRLIWNGTDNSGRPVGSGVYFYRLTTDHYNKVNKMLLVK